jgi:hypothetical protein
MPDLTPEQVRAQVEALGLPVTDDDVMEVTHRLNGFLDALAPLADLPLRDVEPVPIALDDPASP